MYKIESHLNCNVYLPGSFVYCVTTVTSLTPEDESTIPFFWLSAQVHGICTADTNYVHIPAASLNSAETKEMLKTCSSLGLGKECACLLGCTPTVMACEVNAKPFKELTCKWSLFFDLLYRLFLVQDVFYVQLPFDLVPSCRGCVKYSYFISISVQFGKDVPKVLKVPFKVVCRSLVDSIKLDSPPLQPLKVLHNHKPIILSHPDVFGFVEISDDIARGRLAIADASEDHDTPEWAMLLPAHHCPLIMDGDFVREVSEERSSTFFQKAHSLSKNFCIKANELVLVEWRMKHTVFHLGSQDGVSGMLDFGSATCRCYRIHAALVRRSVTKLGFNESKASVFDHVVDEIDLDTFNALSIPVSFHLPKNETQTFSCSWLSNFWAIKFVFLCSQYSIDDDENVDEDELYHESIPPENEMDRIEWELDIPVVITDINFLRDEPNAKHVMY